MSASVFLKAFKNVGGSIHQREPRRYEITHVPAILRQRDRAMGRREVLLDRYERICFEKNIINLPGKAQGAFISPGHPLLDTTIDYLLEQYRNILKQGTVFVNENDPEEEIKCLFYLEHSLQDSLIKKNGQRNVVSRQMQFVEIDKKGVCINAGIAPYLDYRAPGKEEYSLIEDLLKSEWFNLDFESRAIEYAISNLMPSHLNEVTDRREEQLKKIEIAVRDRLLKEIRYWDNLSIKYKEEAEAGKRQGRMTSSHAQKRADELEARLQKRLSFLKKERQISALPPLILGSALVIPKGLIERQRGFREENADILSREKKLMEKAAMDAVMEIEKKLGFQPHDVSGDKCGYDIESNIPESGKLRFIEVKGRRKDSRTVTVTKNEILVGLNKPEDYILAIVEVVDNNRTIYYIKNPFKCELDFGVTSVTLDITKITAKAEETFKLG